MALEGRRQWGQPTAVTEAVGVWAGLAWVGISAQARGLGLVGRAGQRAGLGPDRGVQPPGHCSVPHSSDAHREPAVGQSLVMVAGGDPAPSPGGGECEDAQVVLGKASLL